METTSQPICISPASTWGVRLPLAEAIWLFSAETMRCRERAKKPGDVFPVRNSYHYPLPQGLPAGTPVKLVHFDAGYWIVEACGQHFTVFQTLVDAGFDYEVNGRWLPESDPRVRAVLKRDTLANPPADCCVNGSSVIPPH